MPLPKQKFREIVFQLLFSHEAGEVSSEHADLLHEEISISKGQMREVWQRAMLIEEHKEKLDQKIISCAKDYELERIPQAERNILRLAAYEILFDDEIPPKVAIAEAIRLTRKFSSSQAASFVNGVLDKLFRDQKEQEEEICPPFPPSNETER